MDDNIYNLNGDDFADLIVDNYHFKYKRQAGQNLDGYYFTVIKDNNRIFTISENDLLRRNNTKLLTPQDYLCVGMAEYFRYIINQEEI